MQLGCLDGQPGQFLKLLTALRIRQLGRRAGQQARRAGRAAADNPQRAIQRAAAFRAGGMIVVARQRDRTEDAEHFAPATGMTALPRLRGHGGRGHLRQQVFQEPPPILQQGRPQGLLDPLGGHRLAPLLPLREEFQERFGFAVALGLDRVEFFLRSSAAWRVWLTVRVTNCSASS